jgi:outer membrane protein OmpA-like peptidoglycan-associated protein
MTIARKLGMAGAGLVLGLAMLGPVSAQTLNPNSLEDQIGKALQAPPKPPSGGLTRGLSVGGSAQPDAKTREQQKFIDGLRTRSISIEPAGPNAGAHAPHAPAPAPIAAEERNKIAEIASERPKIDLEIYFDYNSSVIGPKAVPALIALGNVLSRNEFRGTVFLINGYTDGKGSAEYNQGLSQARANSVRHVLIEQYHLAPDALIAVGFGKEHLKLPDQPFADENRRVQIVNTEVNTAGK